MLVLKKKKKDVSSPQFNLFNTIPIEIPAGLFENNNFNWNLYWQINAYEWLSQPYKGSEKDCLSNKRTME